VTLRLVAIEAGADIAALAEKLAPGFGGDEAEPRELLTQTLDLLTRDPRPQPWGSYLAYEGDTPVGLAAFKAAPTPAGEVEIAYMTFPAHEGRGIATAVIAELTGIAFDAGAPCIIAHTLPVENPSNRGLVRNGFTFAGDVIDPEDGPVWRWEKRHGG
jgi:ribosomal-protein-alanine N-acetyltransferase